MSPKSLASLGFFPDPGEQHVPVLEDVLSPSEALVMQDLQALDDPHRAVAGRCAGQSGVGAQPARPDHARQPAAAADEEPVDDELREVFLEETDEVLEVLHEYLPRWSAAPMTAPP
jgi:chemosensory pili system protein ChpA (sensor histidine kinase/response regulator)